MSSKRSMRFDNHANIAQHRSKSDGQRAIIGVKYMKYVNYFEPSVSGACDISSSIDLALTVKPLTLKPTPAYAFNPEFSVGCIIARTPVRQGPKRLAREKRSRQNIIDLQTKSFKCSR